MTQDLTSSTSPQGLAEKLLSHLRELLDQEHAAIMKADAKEISRLAQEKEKIAEALALIDPHVQELPAVSKSLKELSREVKRLAGLNHALLSQLYKHYHGMLEFLTRVAGHGQTYGPSGTLDLGTGALHSRKTAV